MLVLRTLHLKLIGVGTRCVVVVGSKREVHHHHRVYHLFLFRSPTCLSHWIQHAIFYSDSWNIISVHKTWLRTSSSNNG